MQCTCAEWLGTDGSHGSGDDRICNSERARLPSNTVSHNLHISTVIELLNGVRWLAEGRIAQVTLDPGGVGRTSHGAADVNQM